MKKLLILNGGHSEITLIKEAKNLDYFVITTGNDPHLIGHKIADKNIYEDYSNYEKILEIAKSESIDAVVSCANDFGAITASYIAEKMNLPGHDSFETTLLLHQKDNFKKFAKENHLQVANSIEFSDEHEAQKYASTITDFPLIIKPVDLTGGKGVSVVYNVDEYLNGVSTAFERSRKKCIVVEKYIVGTYHSFSTFVVDKKVIAYFSDNEYSYINPFFVASSCGPADNVEKVKDILISQAEKIANLLNLVNGVFHMQYVMDSNFVPYIIDITRRCSGDLYPEPVEHSTGLPWSKWIVLSETGSDSSCFVERGTQNKICGRFCIMPPKNGIIDDVIIADELKKYVYKDILWWKKGDFAKNYIADKCGILFWEFDNRDEMNKILAKSRELVEVIVK